MFYTFDIVRESMRSQVGGKGYHLALLYQAGFPVPEGGVLSVDAFESTIKKDEELYKQILRLRDAQSDSELLMELAQRVKQDIEKVKLPADLIDSLFLYMDHLLVNGYPSIAVRSSAVLEDMEKGSFAGQYESILRVGTKEDLSQAILKCWASCFSSQVIQYCLSKNIPLAELKPAIVLQGMIEAEYAGVLFTVNPVSGDDKTMLIDAVEGLADVLVQGEINPTHYQYNWYTQEHSVTANQHCLSEQQIEQLSLTALEIQKYYGSPQDIEWAYKNGKVFILQSRPIVSIHVESEFQWSNADFKDGGVAAVIPTSLMWSLYENVFEHSMPKFLKSVGLHAKFKTGEIKWTQCFLGFPYWNLSGVKEGVKKIPGFNEREFDNDLGIKGQYKNNGHVTGFNIYTIINGLHILYRIKKSINNRLLTSEQVLKTLDNEITNLERCDLSQLNNNTLYLWGSALVNKHHFFVEEQYFNTVYDNSNAATLFKDALKRENFKRKKKGKESLNELYLISGLGDISHLRHVQRLWELSREFLNQPDMANALLETSIDQLISSYVSNIPFPFYQSIKPYIEVYKHHSERELDLLIPCWDEDPSTVFVKLKQFLIMKDSDNPALNQKKQEQLYYSELEKIKTKSFLKVLHTHRKMLILREEMRNHSTRIYRLIRLTYLEMGKRLTKSDALYAPEGIFNLECHDALEYFKNPKRNDLKNRVNLNRSYYQSFRNYKKPNEIFITNNSECLHQSDDAINCGTELKGVGCSPGIIEAKVWVQMSNRVPQEVEKGIILVAPYTDPAYTLLFSSISGLITETGGILSHGAVVSREFGIPAVLALSNACVLLRSGMWVRLNGHTGQVTIIDGRER